ncbi:MAG TPA: hypothetical protein ENO00_10540 [Deltaproteobacteria bacterium]|nr:hypothetical protein [Deltaproteobacteria bacterium]
MLVDLILGNENEKDSHLLYETFRRDGDAVYAESFVPSAYDEEGAYLWGKASPLYDRKGTTIRTIESIRDVTERNQRDRAWPRYMVPSKITENVFLLKVKKEKVQCSRFTSLHRHRN